MKFVVSSRAEADLTSISDYIAKDSPAAAGRLIDDFLDHCGTIGINPGAYPVVRSVGGLSLRRKVMGRYLIFYMAHDAHVEIVRIIHGSRDLDHLFEN